MTDAWTMRVVAGGVFLILSALIVTLSFFEVPKGNHDIVITLAGAIAGAALSVVSFYFGSSASSRDKDATIKEVATGKGTGP